MRPSLPRIPFRLPFQRTRDSSSSRSTGNLSEAGLVAIITEGLWENLRSSSHSSQSPEHAPHEPCAVRHRARTGWRRLWRMLLAVMVCDLGFLSDHPLRVCNLLSLLVSNISRFVPVGGLSNAGNAAFSG